MQNIKDYVAEEYIIPVTWECFGTVKIVGAKNLEEALSFAREHADEFPLSEGNYVDGSYRISVENDDDALVAQSYSAKGAQVINIA